MAAVYPGALKSFAREVNKGTLADADDYNILLDEVEAVQAELGTDPAGNYADVKTRLIGMSRVLNVDEVTQTVTSTATETNIYSFSLPANTLDTDKLLRFTAYGSFLNNAGVNRTNTFRFYYGSTVALNAVPDPTTSAFERVWMFEAWLSARAATNAQACYGRFRMSGAGGTSGSLGSLFSDADGIHDSIAEDSTGALNVRLSVQHEDNVATIVTTFRYAMLELLGDSAE